MTEAAYSKPASREALRRNWRIMVPLFLVVCIYSAGMASVLPVLPFYLREMGATPLIFGLVLATEAFTHFVAAPTLGQLSDRFGRKRVLLASQAMAAASLFLLAVAPNVFVVIVARALFGLTGGNFSAAAGYVADHTAPEDRRQAISILTGGVGLGGITGAGLSGFLSEASLAVPIFAALFLSIGAIGLTLFALKADQAAPSQTGPYEREKVSFRAIVSSPIIRILIIVMVCHFLAYGIYSSQMPVFLAETFIWNGQSFGPQHLSYIVAADGVINILVQLFLLGWLGRRFSERQLIILIFGLICTGFLIASLATTVPLLALAVLCVSTGDAMAKPTYLAALSVHVPGNRQGVVMGSAQSLGALTDIISPLIGGFILGHKLYGLWVGLAIAVAVIGVVLATVRLPSTDPETRKS
ncbi:MULTISPECIES: MFS transporter [unclassified Shinella]|jgi:DHA1 family tetracycline resistance protein-like MFS transporter|uniref:MFS transporter n=1 Tax=unclassified Shinella TaxID=2643062 RepID=UPI00102D4350|nr:MULTISPECIES: MFS transporter [unclassified Shinella]MCO5151957.1 MFS transporter [Shinella sp.]MDC7264372.1 MFS transporter [Shinella sp. HY16]MDC7271268.1 MFS transporter [Shinella sp. YZ44]MDG4676016.1 MFS transporter [Shinella sp. 838]TAA50733.1 MFS transporter [Shinella sp. JR1-6]